MLSNILKTSSHIEWVEVAWSINHTKSGLRLLSFVKSTFLNTSQKPESTVSQRTKRSIVTLKGYYNQVFCHENQHKLLVFLENSPTDKEFLLPNS